jgi:hypothetical protein
LFIKSVTRNCDRVSFIPLDSFPRSGSCLTHSRLQQFAFLCPPPFFDALLLFAVIPSSIG